MIMTSAVASLVVAVGGVSTTVADAAGGAGADPFTYLTGLGFPGIIIGLLLTGQLRTKTEVERLIAENEHKDGIITAKDNQIKELQVSIADKAIPALVESARVLQNLSTEANTLAQLRSAQQEVADLNARLAFRDRDRP